MAQRPARGGAQDGEPLEAALAAACGLRDAMAAEVERARAERVLLRRLDADALLARAAERGAFLAEAARLERSLAVALARAAPGLGDGPVTLQRLRAAGRGGEVVARALSEVQALAAALQELDRLNLALAGRALACVRGYVEALQPPPRAYDRRGIRAGAPALALVSSKG